MTTFKSYILFLLFLSISILNAKEYKAVFDCSSNDASFIKSRMWLIGKTIDTIEQNGDTAKFAITLHGGCVHMASKEYDMIVADKDLEDTKKAQEYLSNLIKNKGVKTTVCAMSLASNSIEKESVLNFIDISPNSFIDTIGYQNNGYAIMTFK